MYFSSKATVGWLEYLNARGVITDSQCREFSRYISKAHVYPPPVLSQVNGFVARMVKENPELWVAYLAKRRILNEGEVTVTVTIDQHNFLCNLRDSGAINMFGAAPYLQRRFGLDSREAKEVLLEWMKGPHHEYIEEDTNGLP